MKYLDKFEHLTLGLAQIAEFPLDLIAPGQEQTNVVFLADDENSIKILYTDDSIIQIPMIHVKNEDFDIELLAKRLYQTATQHKDYRPSKYRSHIYITRDEWTFGLAIL